MDEVLSKWLGASWRTTLLGIGAMFGAVADIATSYGNGTEPHWHADWDALWIGLVGVFSKDRSVSNAGNPVEARKVDP